MKKLSRKEQIDLREALSHLHVHELEKQLESLLLSTKGFNKKELIDRLMHYACTGKELPPIEIPSISKAQKDTSYPLAPETLMLHGSYKNDAQTRDFFKALIGEHFHFTAYGIDWLRERWLEEDPPTYAEFAEYWQDDYENKTLNKKVPKQELAYIRFTQDFGKANPKASKTELFAAWEEKRKQYVELVHAIFHNEL